MKILARETTVSIASSLHAFVHFRPNVVDSWSSSCFCRSSAPHYATTNYYYYYQHRTHAYQSQTTPLQPLDTSQVTMAPPVGNQPYFVPHQPGSTLAVRDAGDRGTTVEEMPGSLDPEDFAPKLLHFVEDAEPTPMDRMNSMRSQQKASSEGKTVELSSSSAETKGPVKSIVDSVFGSKTQREVKFSALDESAKKAAPKLFFAGERTFLQWMHTGLLLAGLSLILEVHAEHASFSHWFSLLLLPVAIGIIIYSMFQYSKRTYMVAMRSPGPYEDRWGPVVVGCVFIVTLVAQLLVVLDENRLS